MLGQQAAEQVRSGDRGRLDQLNPPLSQALGGEVQVNAPAANQDRLRLRSDLDAELLDERQAGRSVPRHCQEVLVGEARRATEQFPKQ